MSEKIEPALTPEEWREGEFEDRYGDKRVAVHVDHKTRIFVHRGVNLATEVIILPTSSAPKLAALCLHGRITWEMVDAMRRAKVGEWSRFCDEPADYDTDESAEALLASLADLLESLLPPRAQEAP